MFRFPRPRHFCRLCAVGLLAIASSASAHLRLTGKVVAVADGDTITVQQEMGPAKIRLQGIDAPEKAQPSGEQAKQFTTGLVLGKNVSVEVITKDKYGRTVGIVFVGEPPQCLNDELLRAGLAWWFRKYSPGDQRLARLEEEARKAKRGLWAEAHPVPPWQWRHPERACDKDADCVFLPTLCPGCPPCKPTARRIGNRQTLRRIQDQQARGRCANPHCPACADEKNWIGDKLQCENNQCTGHASTVSGPAASALYHGNARSKTFHAPGCRDFACRGCTESFSTVEQATMAGYHPHSCVAPFKTQK
jgi:micrococcal nuclease